MKPVNFIKVIRPQIILRDKEICQKCGRQVSGRQAQVHHIDVSGIKNGYFNNDGNHGLDNLILLCRKCHLKIHAKNVITVDDERLYEMKHQGMTYTKIAKMFGVSHQRIMQRVYRFSKSKLR